MNIAKFIFKGIDVVAYIPENPRSIINKCKKKVEVIKNITYNYQYPDYKADIYIPKTKLDRYKVTIITHGGGFVAGSKDCREALAYYISANSNNIVLNLDYPGSPKYTYLKNVSILSGVFDFIKDRKDEYKFDLNNISTCGDSSGAYYALMLSNVANSKTFQDFIHINKNIKVKNAILDCGFYDSTIADPSNPAFRIIATEMTNLDASVVEENPDKIVNPVEFIGDNNAHFVIAYSTHDPFCGGQTEVLLGSLKALKKKYTAVRSDSLIDGHCFPLFFKTPKAIAFNEAMIKAIK